MGKRISALKRSEGRQKKPHAHPALQHLPCSTTLTLTYNSASIMSANSSINDNASTSTAPADKGKRSGSMLTAQHKKQKRQRRTKCTYFHCELGLIPEENGNTIWKNKSDKRHYHRYHSRNSIAFRCASGMVVFDRNSHYDMQYMCRCGFLFLLPDSIRLHFESRCEPKNNTQYCNIYLDNNTDATIKDILARDAPTRLLDLGLLDSDALDSSNEDGEPSDDDFGDISDNHVESWSRRQIKSQDWL